MFRGDLSKSGNGLGQRQAVWTRICVPQRFLLLRQQSWAATSG
jgi:hypothetical protein